MTTRIFLTLLFSAASLLFGQSGTTKTFTPRPDSRTAMRGCGVDLQQLKESKGFTRRYEFTGEEVLLNMRFCVGGKASVSKTKYKVLAGTIGWTDAEGKSVILEECDNEADFETPVPEETPEVPEQPELPELVLRTPPNLRLTPWTPVRMRIPERPVVVHQCPECVAIMSSVPLKEFGPKSKPIEIWPEIQGGVAASGNWFVVDGKGTQKLVAEGVRAVLDPARLYKAVGNKGGDYFLLFLGTDSDGHALACGKGTPMKLLRKGKHWLWKFTPLWCIDVRKFTDLYKPVVCACVATAILDATHTASAYPCGKFIHHGGAVAAKPPKIVVSPK